MPKQIRLNLNLQTAELRERGRFRKDYEYETFRENLGVA
jgi:hypothetical protein